MEHRKGCRMARIGAFVLPMLFLCALFFANGVYPFGEASNCYSDLQIQYVDFFNYYKDVLAGRAGVEYTLRQSLGGSPVALIGYYLLSPLNLLIVFFPKSAVQLFVFLITALKLGLCGLTFSLFAEKRMKCPPLAVLALALCYSCTQYCVGQLSNLLWLDGVALLPLLLLAVDAWIARRRALPLFLGVCGTILCNWYTGYMNCLFIVFYFLHELAAERREWPMRERMRVFFGFFAAEATGVLASCAVFLPVALAQSGGRSAFDPGVLLWGTNGEAWEMLRGLLIGTPVPDPQITLYCSVLGLALFFAFFFAPLGARKKLAGGALVALMLFSMWAKPVEAIWCGFKFEYSFMYRFAYLGMAAVLLCAGQAATALAKSPRRWAIPAGAGLFALLLALGGIGADFPPKRYAAEFCLLAVYALLALLLPRLRRKALRVAAAALALCLFAGELFANGIFLLDGRFINSAAQNADYIAAEEELIDRLRPAEGDFYRMETTLTRDGQLTHNSFCANESLAYGYSGVTSFTSAYSLRTAQFLADAGYSRSVFPSFYYNPILPVDALLGVRYLLSERAYPGLDAIRTAGENGKNVYANPCALPLGFRVSEAALGEMAREDAFSFTNALYSAVLGEDVAPFALTEPISAAREGEDAVFTLAAAPGSVLYLTFDDPAAAGELYVNGEYLQGYSHTAWASWNHVVLAGAAEEPLTVRLAGCGRDPAALGARFALVDTAALGALCERIRAGAPTFSEISDGRICAHYTAERDGYLLLTLPADPGWSAKVNGERVELSEGCGAFLILPVRAGENEIRLRFDAPGKWEGVALSALGIALFFLLFCRKKKKSPCARGAEGIK